MRTLLLTHPSLADTLTHPSLATTLTHLPNMRCRDADDTTPADSDSAPTLVAPSVAARVLGLIGRTLAAGLLAIGATGCSAEPTAVVRPTASFSQSPTADVAPRWNAVARSLIVSAKPNQQEALRALAYLSLAQYEAALAVSPGGSYGDGGGSLSIISDTSVAADGQIEALPGRVDQTAQLRGAIAAASVDVLKEMFRSSGATIDAAFDAEALTSAESGDLAGQFWLGVETGHTVSARIIAAARADNFGAQWNGEIPAGPGAWFSSVGRPPLLPMLGAMRPFFMTAGSDFRPNAPPAFGSPPFNAALAEIRAYSDTRTPTQDSIAKFWAMATGTLVAGYWNEVATALIAKYHVSELRATHVLALMNAAAMDGNIACHDAKYTYWLIRPSQADPDIKTAIGLPNHPSFPSNHACLSGAAALILANEFPAERAEMERQAEEAVVSRYYAGLHYRFDGDAGLEIARKVAALAIRVDRDLNGKLALR